MITWKIMYGWIILFYFLWNKLKANRNANNKTSKLWTIKLKFKLQILFKDNVNSINLTFLAL